MNLRKMEKINTDTWEIKAVLFKVRDRDVALLSPAISGVCEIRVHSTLFPAVQFFRIFQRYKEDRFVAGSCWWVQLILLSFCNESDEWLN